MERANQMTLLKPMRRTIWRLANRLDGAGLRYHQLRESLAVVRMDQEAVNQMQLESLKRTLSLAGATVPYWRDLFRARSFDPEKLRSISDLAALPILDKATIRAQGNRMISEAFSKERLIVRTTGGSTAEPLRFFVDRRSLEKQMAINIRTFMMSGLEEGDKILKIWGYKSPLTWQNSFRRISGRAFESAYDTGEAALSRWASHLKAFRPKGIYGYAGAIAHFARYLLRTQADIPEVSVIMTTAEKLYDNMRADIQRAFRGTVIDTYGAHECIRLATECRCGTLHLQPDAAVLEFLSDDLSQPEEKRILLTSLTASAMPFIRYDLGDRGTDNVSPCACGSGFPGMRITAGKVHHVFHLKDRTVHSTEFHTRLYRTNGIAMFQIHHVERDLIDLDVVLVNPDDMEAKKNIEQTVKALRRDIGEMTRIRLNIVNKIPTTPRGKHQPILSSVPEDHNNRIECAVGTALDALGAS
jgi:phenylacetate-CoA ligase